MSAKSFVVLARRMWAIREQIDEAYRTFNRERWTALLRRHDRLQDMILNSAREGVIP